MANHKYRVAVDWLEKVVKRDADGKMKELKMFRRGDHVDYSDEPERAKELLEHKAIVLAAPDDEVDDEVDDVSGPTPAAQAAVNDTTNGGGSGGLAKPGPVLDESVPSE